MKLKWLFAVIVLFAIFIAIDADAVEFEEHDQDALTGNTTEPWHCFSLGLE